ncbi:hypothetical protein [Embleya sp. AB8]|uniref:hypothetical protein n=1 Tax=Embleya sp. AB8 TaxID=3156304 RepID=UPI003C72871C
MSSHDSPTAPPPVTNELDLESAEAVRAFCGLCLDPGPGRVRRTPRHFVEIMPPWLGRAVAERAPHLRDHVRRIAAQRAEIEQVEAAMAAEQTVFAEALRAWIAGKPQSVPAKSAAVGDGAA